MGKWLACYCLLLGSVSVVAKPPIGWHWYNEPHPIKKTKRPPQPLQAFAKLSDTDKLHQLQKALLELRIHAIFTGDPNDIASYKAAQDFWTRKVSRFSRGWEQMLLMRPDLNYALDHSHSNAAVRAIAGDERAETARVIDTMRHQYGLLFFYRGDRAIDRQFAGIIKRYSIRHHFSTMAISVDGHTAQAFPESITKEGRFKAHQLGIDYFPALVLVAPKTGWHQIMSYGFQSEADLSNRLVNLQHHWRDDDD